MDRFSSSGLKQKNFSPEWKEIYLLWIHGQDAIELIPPLAIFIHTDFVPVFLLEGHCQHPKTHYHSDSPLCFLHPHSHCKIHAQERGSPQPHYHSVGATQPESPLPSWTLVCKDTLTPFCTSPRLPMFDEPLAIRGWRWGWLLQGACATGTGWSSTLLHPLLTPSRSWSHQPGVAMCKSIACSHCVKAGRQQTKNNVLFHWMQNTPCEVWASGCGVLMCWLPSVQLTPRAAERRGVRRLSPTLLCFSRIIQLLGTLVTNMCQSPLTWHCHSLPDSTGPLHSSLMRPLDSSYSPRSCQTLLGRGSTFSLLCPPPASQAQLSWFRQTLLLWEKQALNLSVL